MKHQSRSSWEAWFSRRQAGSRPIHVYANMLEHARERLGRLAGRRILEVGCGRAATLVEFARAGARAVGVDYAGGALEIGRRLRGAAGPEASGGSIELVQGDAMELPFEPRSFDLVYSAGVLEHFREPERVLQEQHRVLKPGGWLIVQVPQKYTLYTVIKQALIGVGRWPYGGWETQYSAGELERLVESGGFEARRLYGYGSFFLVLARHFLMPSLGFDRRRGFWRKHRALEWIRARTAVEVGVVAAKRLGRGAGA